MRLEPRNIASVKSNAIEPPTTTMMPILAASMQRSLQGETVSCATAAEIGREL